MRQPMTRWIVSIISAAFLGLPVAAESDQFEDFGDYVVHYTALPTTFLPRDVARAYGIRRSKTRAMLNVTVLKKQAGDLPPKPVTADVVASAVNLSGQRKEIDMRTVGDGGDEIYYVGEFTITHLETLDFDIEVKSDENAEPFVIQFRQRFYVL